MQLHYFNEPDGELEPRPPDRNRVKSEDKDGGEFENGDEEPRPFASTLQVIAAMEEAFRIDKDLLLKLNGQALKLIRLYFNKKMLNDLTAEDVVNRVLELLTSGKRKWYKDTVPDIVKLILLVLHSFIRNERKKKKHWLRSIDLYDKDGELIETDIVDVQRAYLREDLADPASGLELEKNLTALFLELEADTIAYFVLEEYLEIDHNEIKKPEAFIAQKLQISEPDVRLAKRRIKRRISKIMETK
ncbi:MAG: hypothetical protein B6D44_13280 [Ignavibacteriales bacterium UTCHB2]|jgi:hypothetical protein|nr:MAG: hypothetical protein B6D44_13280 [Ignavibacteriales bacterium UTCHB2]